MSLVNRNRKSGFTLVEIMIVVLIIGILLAIAVPNFVQARETSRAKSCVANLKQLESGAQQYAMDAKLAGTATVAMTNLVPTYIRTEPKCPSTNAAYNLTTVDTRPTCPNPGTGTNAHVLP